MKSKADGWLFAVAMLASAGSLFLPVPPLQPSRLALPSFETPTLAALLAWLLTALGFWAFRARLWPADQREHKRFSSALLLVLLQALLLRMAVEFCAGWSPEWAWLPRSAWMWIPWFLVPGLAGILLGARFGVLLCLTGAFMLYLLENPGPWPVMGSLMAPLAGVLMLRRAPTRARVMRAGTATGGVLGLVGGAQTAMHSGALSLLGAALLGPLLLGFLSALLVLMVLPLLEWLLGELSDVSVIEYGTDHPLLDELRAKAPGTWYHSLNVADLAEKAAAQIGARALFCRTAALYHDVGKLKDPGLFAENNHGPSLLAQLEPQVSAQKIMEHVAYGLELARKHRLPKAFRDIIAEHHGGSLVRFFYAQACELQAPQSGTKVDRARFCYPGPPPSTRESGIIALADTVEAASRSQPRGADLNGFVGHLFAERISAGELAHCPLTLIDLSRLQAAFVAWLQSREHFRPAYPAAAAEPAALAPRNRPEAPQLATAKPGAELPPPNQPAFNGRSGDQTASLH